MLSQDQVAVQPIRHLRSQRRQQVPLVSPLHQSQLSGSHHSRPQRSGNLQRPRLRLDRPQRSDSLPPHHSVRHQRLVSLLPLLQLLGKQRKVRLQHSVNLVSRLRHLDRVLRLDRLLLRRLSLLLDRLQHLEARLRASLVPREALRALQPLQAPQTTFLEPLAILHLVTMLLTKYSSRIADGFCLSVWSSSKSASTKCVWLDLHTIERVRAVCIRQ
jgi:hypothetical protein